MAFENSIEAENSSSNAVAVADKPATATAGPALIPPQGAEELASAECIAQKELTMAIDWGAVRSAPSNQPACEATTTSRGPMQAVGAFFSSLLSLPSHREGQGSTEVPTSGLTSETIRDALVSRAVFEVKRSPKN